MPFWPACSRGSILISSRSPLSEGEGLASQSAQLDPFSLDQSVSFLRSLLPLNALSCDAEEKSLKEIATTFDGLPLGLKIAGSFMKSKHLSPSKFVKLYAERSEDVLHATLPGTVKKLESIWDVSLDTIATDAQNLLDIFCLLDADMIPIELLEEQYDAKTCSQNLAIHNALEKLSGCSLINVTVNGRGIIIHKYFQSLMLKRLQSSPDRFLAGLEAVLSCLCLTLPPIAYVGRRPENWSALERYLPHMRSLRSKTEGNFPKKAAAKGVDLLCRYGS